jgi:hypothetical protein
MTFASLMSTLPRARRPSLTLALVCAALAALVAATSAIAGASATQASLGEGTKPNASTTLQQCVTSATQTERSATFAGEMSAIPGTAKMEMRVDVLERTPGDLAYRTVTAPGLGVWRVAAPGVKQYTYLKQVTNLSAPAFYRGSIRFRWMSARGRLLKTAVLRTRRCEQPTPAPVETETSLSAAKPGATGWRPG